MGVGRTPECPTYRAAGAAGFGASGDGGAALGTRVVHFVVSESLIAAEVDMFQRLWGLL